MWKFVLNVTDESREAWSTLLGRPDFAERKLAASLGLPEQVPLPSEEAAVLQMKVLTMRAVGGWAALFAVMVAIFAWCATKTNILRNDASAAALPPSSVVAASASETERGGSSPPPCLRSS